MSVATESVADVVLTPVESSMIKSVGYNTETCTMLVEFNQGQIYSYTDVPPEVHQGLLAAKSLGKYFWKHIRGEYTYAKEVSRDKGGLG